jgi:hypothetical protein
MMEASRTSETSVNFYQTTRRNIPEDSPPWEPKISPQLQKLQNVHAIVTKIQSGVWFRKICFHKRRCKTLNCIS